jgi:hypothetical protein
MIGVPNKMLPPNDLAVISSTSPAHDTPPSLNIRVKIDPKSYLHFGKREEEGERSREERRDEEGTGVAMSN